MSKSKRPDLRPEPAGGQSGPYAPLTVLRVAELRTGHVLPVRGRSYDHFAVGRKGTTSCCAVQGIGLMSLPVPHGILVVDDELTIRVDLTGATWSMMGDTPETAHAYQTLP